MSKWLSYLVSSTILFSHLLYQTEGNFLSVDDLEEFYDLEENLAKSFTSFVEEQKQILDVVGKRYEEQSKLLPEVKDADEYLSNPLNVHAMLKRMVFNWPLTLALLKRPLADEEDEDNTMRFPFPEEYLAAVRGIARLQQVYHYTTENIISGAAFPNTDRTSLLTAEDCLAVGKNLYERRDFNLSISWFKAGLALTKSEGRDAATTSRQDSAAAPTLLETLLEYLGLAACFLGNERQSRRYFNKLQDDFPDFRPTPELVKDHILALNDSCSKLIDKDELKPKDHKLQQSPVEDAKMAETYSSLCQAEARPEASRELYCVLTNWGKPYWLLHPFKMELLLRDPFVHITYDVISPSEREFIIEKMMDDETMQMENNAYVYWTPLPGNSSVSEALVRRTQQLSTGAKVHNTTDNTLLSYLPPGGELVIDTDYSGMVPEKFPEKNRLGCTEYFLGAPKEGGLLAFPRLGLSVAPVEGAAITWIRVNREGKADDRVAYGHCPVVRGQMTTLNLWFKR